MSNLHKTTVEIDLAALREAQKHLRTRGIKQTVNAALWAVNRRARLAAAAERVRVGRYAAPDEKTWAEWREPRK